MKLLSRYLMIFVAVAGFSKFLPHIYGISFGQRVERPFLAYSSVINDIVYTAVDKSMNKTYSDISGNTYSFREFSKLLPFIFHRELQKQGEYPDSVGGVRVSAERAARERDTQNIRPYTINKEAARICLFPLYESMGEQEQLEVPGELFRISKRMEFINAEKNEIDEEQSVLFTDALNSVNFAFPAQMISGNPTVRKSYDIGYFVKDSNGEIFHIRKQKGLPSAINTGIAANINGNEEIVYIAVKENINLGYHGLVVTSAGEVYRILKNGYELEKLYIENYNPLADTLSYWMDPLNTTLRVGDGQIDHIYVSGINGKTQEFRYQYDRKIRGVYRTVYDALFPFIVFNDGDTAGRYLKISSGENTPLALLFSFFLTVCAFLLSFFKKRHFNKTDFIFIAAGGIYALIAVLLLDGLKGERL